MHRKTKKREISGWTKPVNIFILPYREVRINKANVNKWFLSAAQVIYNLNGFSSPEINPGNPFADVADNFIVNCICKGGNFIYRKEIVI